MWEPWEYRKEDLDLDECLKKGIKVYGTNEGDSKLRTMDYIGFIVLFFLLKQKHSPFSSNILILGNDSFSASVKKILKQNGYKYTHISDYVSPYNEVNDFDAIVIVEHEKKDLLIGKNGFINGSMIKKDMSVIHICGNVVFDELKCNMIPENPACFGYMSYTTDYIDNQAVIDLHTAGLKVAEGMLQANYLNLHGENYKKFMEKNYFALAFDDQKYW